MNSHIIRTLGLGLIGVTALSTAAPAAPGLQARSIPSGLEDIHIDGRDDDAAWTTVSSVEGFTQVEPAEGDAPSEPTRVRLVHDESALFVFVDAIDSDPSGIEGQLTRRDADSASDWIHVLLDTYDDDTSAYRFSVNPSRVQQDARRYGDVEDVNWNGVWNVATRTSSAGWHAEFRIPFSELGYDANHNRWGLQVTRVLRRKNEASVLSPTPRSTPNFVSHFANLELDRLPAVRALRLVPYALGAIDVRQGNAGLQGSFGGDLSFDPSSSMRLSATINPDFGQVEADPSVLNLSDAETFYEEKRPFFLEGNEFLHFPLGFGDGDLGRYSLFYSRRIGRTPTLGVELKDGEELQEEDELNNIYGALKLTGKMSGGWSIGVLDAVTERSRSMIHSAAGTRDRTTEPMANAFVAQVGKDFGGGKSSVGLMATHQLRMLGEDGRTFWPDQAATLGVQARHRQGEWEGHARLYGSHILGSKEAIERIQSSGVHYFQRPDARHLVFDPAAESLSGYGATFVLGNFGGSSFRGAAGAMLQSPGFDPNQLGYLPRADRQLFFLWAQARETKPGELHRDYQFNANVYAAKTFGPELIGLGANVNGTWTLPSSTMLFAGVGRDLEALDVNALRGGPALLSPGSWSSWMGLQSDARNPVSLAVELSLSKRDDRAGGGAQAKLELRARPSPGLELSLAPAIAHDAGGVQYLDQQVSSGRAVVAALEQSTASLAARANLALAPSLSFELYVQPFLGAGRYTEFREVVAPRAARYADRFVRTESTGETSFLLTELRGSAVLRWEYLPGSTVFFVWSHEQAGASADRGTLSIGEDLARMVSSPSEDVVMVKLSHWLSV